MSVLLEVCVNCASDAIAAAQAGADRIELCSGLELGGLTPTLGCIRETLQAVDVPVVVVIRPRGGGFAYDEHDVRAMLTDARAALEAGAAGLVVGPLTRDGTIDTARCAQFVELTKFMAKDAVFHRAFDFVRNPADALEQLVELGVTRLLTSGQRTSALEGAANIRTLVEQAAGRIEILPGGGINMENLQSIIELTGCNQIHLGLARTGDDLSLGEHCWLELNDLARAGGSRFRTIDTELVRQAAAIVHG
jgi:copper homeostasis protein